MRKTLPSPFENPSISQPNPSKLAQIAPKSPSSQPPRAPLRARPSTQSARLHHGSHLRRTSTSQPLQHSGCRGGMNHHSAERDVFTTVKTSPTIHAKAVPKQLRPQRMSTERAMRCALPQRFEGFEGGRLGNSLQEGLVL